MAGVAAIVLALAAQADEAFTWFDTLGYPDLKDAVLVRATTGHWMSSGNRPPEAVAVEAFLLADRDGQFDLFTLDLEVSRHVKTKEDVPAHLRVGYEAIGLEKGLRRRLEMLEALRKEKDVDLWRRFGERLPERSELFVLARACDRQGLGALAREALGFAATMPERSTGKPPDRPLAKVVADEIAYAEIWRSVLQFEDLQTSREDLLARFDRFAKNFPGSEHAALAKATAENLRRMLKEDRAYRAPAGKFDELPAKARAADLIFRLRDQNGHQWSQPGSCDIFADGRKEASPAHQLVKMGYAAVPQLIEAVDDDRLTRSVGYHRNFYFSHHVLRVGDCALAILERIAGREFWRGTYTNAAMLKDGEASTTKKAIQAWWAEFEKKGEKQMLLEAAERGEPEAADRLVAAHPQLALEAIRKGIASTSNDWERASLVRLLEKLPGEASTALLLEQMKGAKDIGVRINAAAALQKRKHPDVLPALRSEWTRLASSGGAEELAGLILASGTPEAVLALGDGLARKPLEVRMELIDALNRCPPEQAEPIQNAIRDVLLIALEDRTVREGMSGSYGDKSFTDPRVADLAAHALTSRWPERFPFDLGAPKGTRDRQLALLINAGRKEKGLPPLPLPERRKIVALSAAEVAPLIDRCLAGAPEALEAKGLAALPAVGARLAALPADAPGRAALEGAARRMASIVADVGPLPADGGKLAKALEALRGKTLTAEAVVDLVLTGVLNLPEGSLGIRVLVERDDDLSGVTVGVETFPGQKAKDQWAHGLTVQLGAETLRSSSGAGTYDHGVRRETYDDLLKFAGQVLEAPPSTPFLIRVTRQLQ